MNRRDRRSSSGLPTLGGAWEVAVVPSPFEVDDVEIVGLMLVAEAESGLIRLAAPLTHVDEIRDQLIRACREPVAGTRAGRPAVLHCTDPDLMDQLRDLTRMLEIEMLEVEALPTIREAEAALRNASGLPAPGITQLFDPWRKVLVQLATLAPWRTLDEHVLFSFRGSPLDGAVAHVIGRGGESLGVVLYESLHEYRRFLAAVDDPESERFLQSVACLSAHLEPADSLTDADVAACIELGLALPGGRYPRLISLQDGEPQPCSAEEQRALLAAVEAVTELCARELASIAAGTACTLSLTAATGWRLEVTATPAATPSADQPDAWPNLVEADHAVVCGSIEVEGEGVARHPCVVFKLRKADAVRLARQCRPLVAIELRGDESTGLAVVACDKDGPLGQLVAYPAGPEASAIGRHLASQSALYLAISSGGPKRPGIQPEDFVYAETLPTRGRERWS